MPKTSSRRFLNHVKKRLKDLAFSQRFQEMSVLISSEKTTLPPLLKNITDVHASSPIWTICGPQLTERFTGHRAMLGSLQVVLPNHAAHSSFESLQPAVEFYMADMEPRNLKVVKGEWEIW
ncbi:hypothetical protein MTO96_046530 [Rhipicephalus appendiculatus]